MMTETEKTDLKPHECCSSYLLDSNEETPISITRTFALKQQSSSQVATWDSLSISTATMTVKHLNTFNLNKRDDMIAFGVADGYEKSLMLSLIRRRVVNKSVGTIDKFAEAYHKLKDSGTSAIPELSPSIARAQTLLDPINDLQRNVHPNIKTAIVLTPGDAPSLPVFKHVCIGVQCSNSTDTDEQSDIRTKPVTFDFECQALLPISREFMQLETQVHSVIIDSHSSKPNSNEKTVSTATMSSKIISYQMKDESVIEPNKLTVKTNETRISQQLPKLRNKSLMVYTATSDDNHGDNKHQEKPTEKRLQSAISEDLQATSVTLRKPANCGTQCDLAEYIPNQDSLQYRDSIKEFLSEITSPTSSNYPYSLESLLIPNQTKDLKSSTTGTMTVDKVKNQEMDIETDEKDKRYKPRKAQLDMENAINTKIKNFKEQQKQTIKNKKLMVILEKEEVKSKEVQVDARTVCTESQTAVEVKDEGSGVSSSDETGHVYADFGPADFVSDQSSDSIKRQVDSAAQCTDSPSQTSYHMLSVETQKQDKFEAKDCIEQVVSERLQAPVTSTVELSTTSTMSCYQVARQRSSMEKAQIPRLVDSATLCDIVTPISKESVSASTMTQEQISDRSKSTLAISVAATNTNNLSETETPIEQSRNQLPVTDLLGTSPKDKHDIGILCQLSVLDSTSSVDQDSVLPLKESEKQPIRLRATGLQAVVHEDQHKDREFGYIPVKFLSDNYRALLRATRVHTAIVRLEDEQLEHARVEFVPQSNMLVCGACQTVQTPSVVTAVYTSNSTQTHLDEGLLNDGISESKSPLGQESVHEDDFDEDPFEEVQIQQAQLNVESYSRSSLRVQTNCSSSMTSTVIAPSADHPNIAVKSAVDDLKSVKGVETTDAEIQAIPTISHFESQTPVTNSSSLIEIGLQIAEDAIEPTETMTVHSVPLSTEENKLDSSQNMASTSVMSSMPIQQRLLNEELSTRSENSQQKSKIENNYLLAISQQEFLLSSKVLTDNTTEMEDFINEAAYQYEVISFSTGTQLNVTKSDSQEYSDLSLLPTRSSPSASQSDSDDSESGSIKKTGTTTVKCVERSTILKSSQMLKLAKAQIAFNHIDNNSQTDTADFLSLREEENSIKVTKSEPTSSSPLRPSELISTASMSPLAVCDYHEKVISHRKHNSCAAVQTMEEEAYSQSHKNEQDGSVETAIPLIEMVVQESVQKASLSTPDRREEVKSKEVQVDARTVCTESQTAVEVKDEGSGVSSSDETGHVYADFGPADFVSDQSSDSIKRQVDSAAQCTDSPSQTSYHMLSVETQKQDKFEAKDCIEQVVSERLQAPVTSTVELSTTSTMSCYQVARQRSSMEKAQIPRLVDSATLCDIVTPISKESVSASTMTQEQISDRSKSTLAISVAATNTNNLSETETPIEQSRNQLPVTDLLGTSPKDKHDIGILCQLSVLDSTSSVDQDSVLPLKESEKQPIRLRATGLQAVVHEDQHKDREFGYIPVKFLSDNYRALLRATRVHTAIVRLEDEQLEHARVEFVPQSNMLVCGACQTVQTPSVVTAVYTSNSTQTHLDEGLLNDGISESKSPLGQESVHEDDFDEDPFEEVQIQHAQLNDGISESVSKGKSIFTSVMSSFLISQNSSSAKSKKSKFFDKSVLVDAYSKVIDSKAIIKSYIDTGVSTDSTQLKSTEIYSEVVDEVIPPTPPSSPPPPQNSPLFDLLDPRDSELMFVIQAEPDMNDYITETSPPLKPLFCDCQCQTSPVRILDFTEDLISVEKSINSEPEDSSLKPSHSILAQDVEIQTTGVLGSASECTSIETQTHYLSMNVTCQTYDLVFSKAERHLRSAEISRKSLEPLMSSAVQSMPQEAVFETGVEKPAKISTVSVSTQIEEEFISNFATIGVSTFKTVQNIVYPTVQGTSSKNDLPTEDSFKPDEYKTATSSISAILQSFTKKMSKPKLIKAETQDSFLNIKLKKNLNKEVQVSPLTVSSITQTFGHQYRSAETETAAEVNPEQISSADDDLLYGFVNVGTGDSESTFSYQLFDEGIQSAYLASNAFTQTSYSPPPNFIISPGEPEAKDGIEAVVSENVHAIPVQVVNNLVSSSTMSIHQILRIQEWNMAAVTSNTNNLSFHSRESLSGTINELTTHVNSVSTPSLDSLCRNLVEKDGLKSTGTMTGNLINNLPTQLNLSKVDIFGKSSKDIQEFDHLKQDIGVMCMLFSENSQLGVNHVLQDTCMTKNTGILAGEIAVYHEDVHFADAPSKVKSQDDDQNSERFFDESVSDKEKSHDDMELVQVEARQAYILIPPDQAFAQIEEPQKRYTSVITDRDIANIPKSETVEQFCTKCQMAFVEQTSCSTQTRISVKVLLREFENRIKDVTSSHSQFQANVNRGVSSTQKVKESVITEIKPVTSVALVNTEIQCSPMTISSECQTSITEDTVSLEKPIEYDIEENQESYLQTAPVPDVLISGHELITTAVMSTRSILSKNDCTLRNLPVVTSQAATQTANSVNALESEVYTFPKLVSSGIQTQPPPIVSTSSDWTEIESTSPICISSDHVYVDIETSYSVKMINKEIQSVPTSSTLLPEPAKIYISTSTMSDKAVIVLLTDPVMTPVLDRRVNSTDSLLSLVNRYEDLSAGSLDSLLPPKSISTGTMTVETFKIIEQMEASDNIIETQDDCPVSQENLNIITSVESSNLQMQRKTGESENLKASSKTKCDIGLSCLLLTSDSLSVKHQIEQRDSIVTRDTAVMPKISGELKNLSVEVPTELPQQESTAHAQVVNVEVQSLPVAFSVECQTELEKKELQMKGNLVDSTSLTFVSVVSAKSDEQRPRSRLEICPDKVGQAPTSLRRETAIMTGIGVTSVEIPTGKPSLGASDEQTQITPIALSAECQTESEEDFTSSSLGRMVLRTSTTGTNSHQILDHRFKSITECNIEAELSLSGSLSQVLAEFDEGDIESYGSVSMVDKGIQASGMIVDGCCQTSHSLPSVTLSLKVGEEENDLIQPVFTGNANTSAVSTINLMTSATMPIHRVHRTKEDDHSTLEDCPALMIYGSKEQNEVERDISCSSTTSFLNGDQDGKNTSTGTMVTNLIKDASTAEVTDKRISGSKPDDSRKSLAKLKEIAMMTSIEISPIVEGRPTPGNSDQMLMTEVSRSVVSISTQTLEFSQSVEISFNDGYSLRNSIAEAKDAESIEQMEDHVTANELSPNLDSSIVDQNKPSDFEIKYQLCTAVLTKTNVESVSNFELAEEDIPAKGLCSRCQRDVSEVMNTNSRSAQTQINIDFEQFPIQKTSPSILNDERTKELRKSISEQKQESTSTGTITSKDSYRMERIGFQEPSSSVVRALLKSSSIQTSVSQPFHQSITKTVDKYHSPSSDSLHDIFAEFDNDGCTSKNSLEMVDKEIQSVSQISDTSSQTSYALLPIITLLHEESKNKDAIEPVESKEVNATPLPFTNLIASSTMPSFQVSGSLIQEHPAESLVSLLDRRSLSSSLDALSARQVSTGTMTIHQIAELTVLALSEELVENIVYLDQYEDSGPELKRSGIQTALILGKGDPVKTCSEIEKESEVLKNDIGVSCSILNTLSTQSKANYVKSSSIYNTGSMTITSDKYHKDKSIANLPNSFESADYLAILRPAKSSPPTEGQGKQENDFSKVVQQGNNLTGLSDGESLHSEGSLRGYPPIEEAQNDAVHSSLPSRTQMHDSATITIMEVSPQKISKKHEKEFEQEGVPNFFMLDISRNFVTISTQTYDNFRATGKWSDDDSLTADSESDAEKTGILQVEEAETIVKDASQNLASNMRDQCPSSKADVPIFRYISTMTDIFYPQPNYKSSGCTARKNIVQDIPSEYLCSNCRKAKLPSSAQTRLSVEDRIGETVNYISLRPRDCSIPERLRSASLSDPDISFKKPSPGNMKSVSVITTKVIRSSMSSNQESETVSSRESRLMSRTIILARVSKCMTSIATQVFETVRSSVASLDNDGFSGASSEVSSRESLSLQKEQSKSTLRDSAVSTAKIILKRTPSIVKSADLTSEARDRQSDQRKSTVEYASTSTQTQIYVLGEGIIDSEPTGYLALEESAPDNSENLLSDEKSEYLILPGGSADDDESSMSSASDSFLHFVLSPTHKSSPNLLEMDKLKSSLTREPQADDDLLDVDSFGSSETHSVGNQSVLGISEGALSQLDESRSLHRWSLLPLNVSGETLVTEGTSDYLLLGIKSPNADKKAKEDDLSEYEEEDLQTHIFPKGQDLVKPVIRDISAQTAADIIPEKETFLKPFEDSDYAALLRNNLEPNSFGLRDDQRVNKVSQIPEIPAESCGLEYCKSSRDQGIQRSISALDMLDGYISRCTDEELNQCTYVLLKEIKRRPNYQGDYDIILHKSISNQFTQTVSDSPLIHQSRKEQVEKKSKFSQTDDLNTKYSKEEREVWCQEFLEIEKEIYQIDDEVHETTEMEIQYLLEKTLGISEIVEVFRLRVRLLEYELCDDFNRLLTTAWQNKIEVASQETGVFIPLSLALRRNLIHLSDRQPHYIDNIRDKILPMDEAFSLGYIRLATTPYLLDNAGPLVFIERESFGWSNARGLGYLSAADGTKMSFSEAWNAGYIRRAPNRNFIVVWDDMLSLWISAEEAVAKNILLISCKKDFTLCKVRRKLYRVSSVKPGGSKGQWLNPLEALTYGLFEWKTGDLADSWLIRPKVTKQTLSEAIFVPPSQELVPLSWKEFYDSWQEGLVQLSTEPNSDLISLTDFDNRRLVKAFLNLVVNPFEASHKQLTDGQKFVKPRSYFEFPTPEDENEQLHEPVNAPCTTTKVIKTTRRVKTTSKKAKIRSQQN
nr:hypothetical transcript [Hymenolepis microstoma]